MKKKTFNVFQTYLRALTNVWESPWKAALFAGFIYLIVSIYSKKFFSQSEFSYYNYLADAFLHGKTWLRIIPPSVHDLVFFNGRYYLYWPPFPAILFLPFVLIFNVQFNDVWFTLCIAAINVGLTAQLLRAANQIKLLNLSTSQRAILTFFFALGTVHFTLAPFGKVWMTGQLIGYMCVLFAYLAAFSLNGGKAWFFTGLALSCAMLTRNHLVFTGIFPAIYLLLQEKPWRWRNVIRNLAFAAIPLFIGLFIYLFYNYIRFGSPLDVGMAYHNMSEFFRADYKTYGAFNVHYLTINFYYQYLFYPFPLRQETMMGGSLFLLSPLFIGAFFSFWRPRSKIIVYSLLISIMITTIPILLLMGTGWVQFGPRYTLDFTVPLLLLTALGIEEWKPSISLALAIIAFVQYIIGIKFLMSI